MSGGDDNGCMSLRTGYTAGRDTVTRRKGHSLFLAKLLSW